MQINNKCRICGKAVVEEYKPFCSKRCADVDLGRWFNGSYAVAAEEIPEEYDSEDNE